MAVLVARHLRVDFDVPDDPANDHLIFPKGHASPLYYAMLRAVGAIGDEELLTFRRFGSRLEGHPTPELPWGPRQPVRRDRRQPPGTARPDRPTARAPHRFEVPGRALPSHEVGASVSTREAYGTALAAVRSIDGRVVALDGEVANSTFSELFQKEHPDRFVESYIAGEGLAVPVVDA